ncbi:uncharacterized protein BXIN_0364 [Babesia sp. Xinjiang]|uniref:uncharacterized protein n=1 Tax=Babesia sp. Xinjiang TaxID=462227 RepID=UPI000A21E9EE|nr:uncharacterized protein BXIN_0364 [Babesia sp. Xinjiang]ORM41183.1 hypothetical protein BXIN_0364 [Babesia sp. Xinjiang]
MSASPSTLLLRGKCGSYGDTPAVSDYPSREQRRQSFMRHKRQDSSTEGSTTVAYGKATRRVSSSANSDTSESHQEASMTPAQRCASKEVPRATRRRYTRSTNDSSLNTDVPSSGSATLGDSVTRSKVTGGNGGSKVPDPVTAKDTSTSAKRPLEPSSEATRDVKYGTENRKNTFIDSTLLDEALNNEDIAKAQSDLQDIDSLSLSHSHSHSHVGSVDEDDERKRKRRKCSRLQETILRVLSKARSDVHHLDEKIASLESQYFSQPDDTTGLIKGWESNLIGGIHANSHNSKARKGLPPKAKQCQGRAQTFINEHIFSLTSSNCAVSKTLLDKHE